MTDKPIAAETFPPGEYLRDELEERGWTVAEFAGILGRPTQAVSEIINGRKEITPETATEIASALGTGAEVWLNLQTAHRLRQLRAEPHHLGDVARRARLRSLVPVTEIRRLGWIPDTNDLATIERAVAGLLGISDRGEAPTFAAAARRSDAVLPLSPAQRAWLGRVSQLAAMRRAEAFDAARAAAIGSGLAASIVDPHAFAQAPSWLAEAGIALVVVPALRGSKIDGAALRLPSGGFAIGLSLRGNRFDSAVFTLAHELAHLVLGHVDDQVAVLDESLTSGDLGGIEAAADARASSWLFPIEPRIDGPISAVAVRRAAAELGCHPALVVGRLQWRGLLPWSHLRNLTPKMTDVGIA